MPFLLCLLVFLLSVVSNGRANTEIINFAVKEKIDAVPPVFTDLSLLSPDSPHVILNATSAPLGTQFSKILCQTADTGLGPCPYEYWVILDLDQGQWAKFDKFTLRASWAASDPTDVSLHIFEPLGLAPLLSDDPKAQPRKSRLRYAKVRLIHTGILTPTDPFDEDCEKSRYQVPIHLIVEPLHFGVLPPSVIPVLAAIAFAICLGYPVARKLTASFESIAEKARQDIADTRKTS